MNMNFLSGLSGFGANAGNAFNQAQNSKFDLMAELEKERRKQMLAEEMLRKKQTQQDVFTSGAHPSDMPGLVEALSRPDEERFPDLEFNQNLAMAQERPVPTIPKGVSGIGDETPSNFTRESQLMKTLGTENSMLGREFQAESLRKQGKMGRGGVKDDSAYDANPVKTLLSSILSTKNTMDKSFKGLTTAEKIDAFKTRIAGLGRSRNGKSLSPEETNAISVASGLGAMFNIDKNGDATLISTWGK